MERKSCPARCYLALAFTLISQMPMICRFKLHKSGCKFLCELKELIRGGNKSRVVASVSSRHQVAIVEANIVVVFVVVVYSPSNNVGLSEKSNKEQENFRQATAYCNVVGSKQKKTALITTITRHFIV